MPNPKTATSVLSDARFGFRTRQVETVVLATIAPQALIANNPDRIFLQLILEGSFDVRIGRNGTLTTASGIPLQAPNGIVTFSPERDGEGTGYERWLVSNGGSSSVRVIETIRAAFAGV